MYENLKFFQLVIWKLRQNNEIVLLKTHNGINLTGFFLGFFILVFAHNFSNTKNIFLGAMRDTGTIRKKHLFS